ncbi:VOC family protein [bacterium]|jgi:catechol 2,3-dioxygenase-like lactoylglutathione lyase family enzyme|nr:VOC family protein [bacterium]
MFKGLSHVMFYVEDVEKTIGWYEEVLGFKRNFFSEWYGSARHDEMGVQFDFHKTDTADFSRCYPPVPYFSTEDFDEDSRALVDRGLKLEEIRSEGESQRFTTFQDCDGNWLGLIESK